MNDNYITRESERQLLVIVIVRVVNELEPNTEIQIYP